MVRVRLGAAGADLDASDLDACYAQAFHGLYAAVLDGQEIANPAGWLAVVTFRRAIEERRARRHLADVELDGAEDRDFAGELDDRIRLRQLFEGLRGRLSGRELQAATLKFAHNLMKKNPAALRYTKECIRAVRGMDVQQAADYLNAKSDALRYRDPEKGRAEATKQFLDDKSFKPGLGNYQRKSGAGA